MPRIGRCYNYSNEEIASLEKYMPFKPDNWSQFKEIKDSIRKHLLIQQDCKCAYCEVIVTPRHYPPIEHIVSKSQKPEFMFIPQNHAISCQCCNSNKGHINTLVDETTCTYPKDGTGFIIVHPHYDEYSEHIRIELGFTFVGITERGIKTIEICGLNKIKTAEEKIIIDIIEGQSTKKKELLLATKTNDSNKIENIANEL